MSAFEIDHLFIASQPGAPEIEEVLALGFLEGTPNVHPGQGTANRRIFFLPGSADSRPLNREGYFLCLDDGSLYCSFSAPPWQ